MYQQDQGYYSQPYHDEENIDNDYGYNYRSYRLPNQDPSIKGKIEQKYWRGKQKVIEKLGKNQDEYVIAGDAEVDARLEAFNHIKVTCMQLMTAMECYQNKIFALSQDENDMGRFLRDQGATDKTKAGKMMIAVGKAQSYAAQQRLALRAPLVRLFAEIETFRLRAIQDTQLTVEKMEQSRSDYRARLLWMADLSKELDPDQNKRLDKFREVQFQVKSAKKLFDKLKGDVIQKIDLLSASRCNLLSATLEPYQTAMVKFLSTTSKSYNAVYNQYQGHPSYQFQILKHILPNNGIVDDEDEEVEEKKSKSRKSSKSKPAVEKAQEVSENTAKEETNDNDDKLITFDASPSEENAAPQRDPPPKSMEADLLGGLTSDEMSPGFDDFTSDQNNTGQGFEDILGKFEENNVLANSKNAPKESFSLLGDIEDPELTGLSNGSNISGNTLNPPTQSVDDLLFGSPSHNKQTSNSDENKSDFDILSDVLSNQSLGITEVDHNSFSDQWNSMFGDTTAPPNQGMMNQSIPNDSIETASNGNQMFLPSFLMDQMRKVDPVAMSQGPPKDFSAIKDSNKISKTPPQNRKKKGNTKPGDVGGKDMSAWFNLFADLDPLANPDAIGATEKSKKEKQAC